MNYIKELNVWGTGGLLHEMPIQKNKQASSRPRAFVDPVSMYENNIGKLQPITADLLKAWSIERGEALVMAAIELAVKRGGLTFRYVEANLKEWARAGIMTVEAMEDYEQKKRCQGRF